ncbi:MauE/DoxX family redox-associated membrane protein [Asanoa sp. NPDC050611]|uniref:MauE/DoxX family redox-associated membrane protein n=1 Tax=Asanoa sp. NPDC050611 TaxID=3157098 RepID=UPI003408CF6C
MLATIAALQAPLVGVVLVWAARFKLFSRHAAASARRSALARLVGADRALPAYRLLGGAELLIGALLILPPVARLEGLAATGLSVGFLGYLAYAKRVAPDAPCGCLGAAPVPVAGRSIARAAVLVPASVLATWAGTGWWAELTAPGALLLAAELALVVALSPELDHRWLLPLRQVWVNLSHPLRGGSGVPLLRSVQQLQQSGVYRRVGGLISSDVREHWDEDEWRMICYAARYQGRPATAVFAVPLRDWAPESVRVALVDDRAGATLATLPAPRPADAEFVT